MNTKYQSPYQLILERDEARRVARQWYRTAHGEHEMVLFYQEEMTAAKAERDALRLQLDAANRMLEGWINSPEYKAYIERINERSDN